MDSLSTEMESNEKVGIRIEDKELNNLLYVDDALTVAEGKEQQEETLKCVNDFATKHKIKWGVAKCKVLELGCHTNVRKTWKLGDQIIESADSYKYLGDVINRKGSNKENIDERTKKLKKSTREIIVCGTSTTMKRLHTKLMIELHETINIPSMLNNCESWLLTDGDLKDLEKLELWCLKRILNLPPPHHLLP